jgi:hypothetical protein
MDNFIQEKDATDFSGIFYQGSSDGKSIKDAVN